MYSFFTFLFPLISRNQILLLVNLSVEDSTVVSADWPSAGEIVFQNVAVLYQGSTEPIVNDINIHIMPGEKVGQRYSLTYIYPGETVGQHYNLIRIV